MTRPILKPGALHPITVTPTDGRVTVTAGGRTIVDTTRALTLKESVYPAVIYVPREDTDMSALEPSESASYCPYKGEASYFSIRTDGGLLPDAVWSYEDPHDAVPEIAGRLAFYRDRVEITQH
ncbi:DUF427 domain-containing protein [Nocardioides bizhenqiangii]|uniref:DUF427 domain-containing protein n=1 Tax=Nocardioides bizhenqiangii TaxID=3095076 RepID=A0ABZ0ZSR2_9ACTN|nr:DUF427 domain-containing protein [Nocardioides sp. HM61]WQQ27322.1 DUF427 domain-containing protein [Nocardioides sp. HM61]